MHQPSQSSTNQAIMWSKQWNPFIFIIIWVIRLTGKFGIWEILALFKDFPIVSHVWLCIAQYLWFPNLLNSFSIPLSALMISLLALVLNLVLLYSLSPPYEDSYQPSVPSMSPQATHSYTPPDQNARQSPLSNILLLFSDLPVTRALKSVLMKVEILLD